MKIQKSRNSRQPEKDYSSVCHQQGRMLTDSDLTEQALLSRDRLNLALRDLVGSGTPRHGALMRLTESGTDLLPSLHWGRAYVDGIPAEVKADADAPDADALDLGDAAAELERYAAAVEADPARLARLEERIAQIERPNPDIGVGRVERPLKHDTPIKRDAPSVEGTPDIQGIGCLTGGGLWGIGLDEVEDLHV